ncbi:hypothetical protein QP445_14505, partial [Micrococcus luteus]|nr:hypothetical protein [Micrococcus luteus]
MSIKKSLLTALSAGGLILAANSASAALQQNTSITEIVDGSSSAKTESFRITVHGIFPESEYERLFNGTLENA